MLIGVLGGSFDPPHLAHRALAECAQRELFLDAILWVPASLQWQKASDTSPDIRAHMCELAISEVPGWQVSYSDLDRGGPTYTVDTLADLAVAYPEDEFVLLLGADAASGLATWHEVDTLKQVRIAVAPRAGVVAQLPEGFTFEHLSCELPDISSSQVRERVTAGESIDELVEPAVAQYIQEVGLYA